MPPVTVVASRRWLAAAVFAAPSLIAVNSLFHPPVDISASAILSGAETGPSAWFIVHVIAAIGALVGIPAALGVRLLVGHRGQRLATAGVATAVISGTLLAIAFAAEASALRLAASAPIDESSALAIAEAYTRTPEFFVIPVAVLAGAIGNVLLMSALLVSNSVPRWQPVAYIMGTLATLAAVPGSLLGPVAFGVVAVVSAFLAARIVRDTTPVAAGSGPLLQPATTS